MIGQVIAAVAGTVGFSVLYSVPRAYYPYCGFIGGAGWFLYCLLLPFRSPPEATLFAAILVVTLSRVFAVWERCPVTIFLISGIFPLVPGGGVYWTAYYIVTGEVELAARTGFAAFKVAVAIVLAIVFVFQLPQKLFGAKKRRKP
ncbi:MAG: threonine/serine exporter [Hungatella sp.]|nr:threonine/serine exporter [Hungatella sp.]